MRPEEVKRALNAVLPTELRVLHVHAVSGTKKLMAQSESAAYRVKFHFQNDEDCDKIKEAAGRLCAAERYIARDRKNREIDIRPLLLEAEVQEDVYKRQEQALPCRAKRSCWSIRISDCAIWM